jgi:hypothetical protein
MTRASKRQRGVRQQRRTLAISDRDLDILTLVGVCRHVTSEQLRREFFPSADRARRRLRRLFDAKLLAVTLVNSREPNILSLTHDGRALVLDRRPELGESVRLAGPLRLASCAHALACVDGRLYCAALAARRGAALSAWSNPGGALHLRLDLKRWHLAPDGIAEFTPPGAAPVYVAVEVDRGTEDLSRVLQAKLLRYRSLAQAGTVDALWLILFGGERRRAGVASLVREVGLSEWVRVLGHADVTTRPVRELPPPVGEERRAESPNMPVTGHARSAANLGVSTP